MASKIDLPLDDLVGKTGQGSFRFRRGQGANKRGGRGGGMQNTQGGPIVGNTRGRARGRGRGITTRALRASANAHQNGLEQKSGGIGMNDLRDLLATKTKTAVTDLRAKLPPKQPTPQNNKSKKKQGNKQPNGQGGRGVRPAQQISLETFSISAPGKRTLVPGTYSYRANLFSEDIKPVSRRLPTAAEAKRITVTVQGLSKTTSEAYRKEERLAATILRQKESRQQNFMKSREEFIASSITSAFVGGGGGGGGVAHVEPMRGGPVYGKYRTPSPVEYHTFEPPIEMRPPMPPPPGTPRQRGLTTVTTLVISNLNDTVSRNDIYELCGAIGPLEHVAIVAPGVAEVTYRYKDDALEAYKKYNQRNLDGMPMMCRLQSGGRTRGPLPMAGTGYPGRIADQYPPEPMYGAPSGGFY